MSTRERRSTDGQWEAGMLRRTLFALKHEGPNVRTYLIRSCLFTVTLLVATGLPALADPGLAAAYDFSELSGTTTADGSGNGNTGTITDAAWSPLGFKGACLSFDGSNGCVAIPDSNSLDLTSEMTLEVWVYPTALPQSGEWRIIDKRVNSDTYMMAVGPDYLRGGFASDESPQQYYYAVQNTALPINRWTHLAVTFDGVQVKLYVNGSRAAICDAPGKVIRTTGESLYLARDFRGRVDRIRIHGRARTDREAAQAAIRLRLRFNEGSGTVAVDSSDYGNNGQVGNASWSPEKYTLSGQVTLQGFVGNLSLLPVELELTSGADTITRQITLLSNPGGYSFDSLDPGAYTLKVAAAGFLREVAVINVTSPTVHDVLLRNGDLDGDNRIGISDFSILSGSFGRSGN